MFKISRFAFKHPVKCLKILNRIKSQALCYINAGHLHSFNWTPRNVLRSFRCSLGKLYLNFDSWGKNAIYTPLQCVWRWKQHLWQIPVCFLHLLTILSNKFKGLRMPQSASVWQIMFLWSATLTNSQAYQNESF